MPFEKGYTPWNKGKKVPDGFGEKISAILYANPRKPWLGKKMSESHKKSIGIGVKKNPNVMRTNKSKASIWQKK